MDETASASRRYVIQNVDLQLRATDVSAAFLKARQLVHPEAGEFIENSSLSGDGQFAAANLTLRVAAGRLDNVLNDLRKLGKVTSEQVTGRDVTTEVVDVEAQLRNERRVEKELLELMESRKDAPLTELMQLRESLKTVRYSIESLSGRRETLSRLVSLATILVFIRADTAEPEPVKESFWSYFGAEINAAWTASIRFLADAVAAILRVLVGGMPFWVLIVVVVWIAKKKKA